MPDASPAGPTPPPPPPGEESLRRRLELEDQLARIAESVPGMLCSFRLRPDGTACMPFATAAIEEIYGLRPEEVRDDFSPIVERIHAEDRARLQAGIAESARTLRPWHDLFRARHPQKGEIWVEGHSVPRREPDGGVLWHGFVQEVTGRVVAEAALRHSEEKFRIVAENTFDWEFWIGPDGRFLYTSPSCRRITGYSPDEFAADQCLMDRIVHPEDRALYQAHHRRSLDGHSGEEQRFRIVRSDGEVRWIGHVCSAVRDGAGVFLGVRGSNRDLTERLRADARLTGLNRCLLQCGADADRNIDSLVGFLGEQMGATCAMYHRLEGGLLHTPGRWRVPADVPSVDRPEGHICHDVIRSGATRACLLRDLPVSEYARTDPTIARFGLKTYLGLGVRVDEECVGSLCVLYDEDREPDPADVNLLGIVASAVGSEEKRRRADAVLRESATRFRALIEKAPDGVVLCRRDGVLSYASPAACRMFGIEAGRVGEVEPTASTHPEDRPAVLGALGELLQDPSQVRTLQYRFRHACGDWIWIESTFTNQIGVPGVDAIVINFQDITARKRAELSLAAEATRRRILIEGSRDGIVVLDREGKVLEANRRFAEMLGYTAEEVRDLHVWDWDREWPREKVLAAIRELGPEGAHFESRHWRKDGSCLDVELSNSVAELAGQRLVFCVCHDVTQRKRLELHLLQSRKLEAIGQLAGGVAHDFNNLLASILMQLDEIQSTAGLDPALQQTLAEMESEARRAASLTRQLLMFSRRSVLDVKPLDLNEVVTDLLKMLRRLIGEQVRLVFDSYTGVLPTVSADAGMLEQALMNLVVNARDAMPRGGSVTVRTTVRSLGEAEVGLNASRRVGRFVCLEVADTGTGMDRETLGRLFEPFFTTKEPGRGTGLGLATVHGIVAQHQGWIEVESELGMGTTFRVFLPALAAPVAPDVGESPSEPVRRGTECILLVEDESPLRRTIALSLRALGYRVLEAETGREALELWRDHGDGIDLLFSDMVMPEGLTGLDLAAEMRVTKPTLKVVISSGYSTELFQAGGIKETGITYLAKPYQARTLGATVRACLDDPAPANPS